MSFIPPPSSTEDEEEYDDENETPKSLRAGAEFCNS